MFHASPCWKSQPRVALTEESPADSQLALYSGIPFWLELLLQVSPVITFQKAFKNKTNWLQSHCSAEKGGGRGKIDASTGRKESTGLSEPAETSPVRCTPTADSQGPLLGQCRGAPEPSNGTVCAECRDGGTLLTEGRPQQ